MLCAPGRFLTAVFLPQLVRPWKGALFLRPWEEMEVRFGNNAVETAAPGESVIDLAVPLSVSIGDGPDWLSAH